MTSSSDQFGLTRLFLRPPVGQATQEWMGGVMTEWNAITYTNTVVVGPTTHHNLPVVSPNGLTEGPVLLAKVANGLIVVGMLTRPGGQSLDLLRYREQPTDVSFPNTTLIDAGILNFVLNPATKYALDGVVFYVAHGSADIKFAWTGPLNMAVRWAMDGTPPGTLGTSGDFESWTLTAYGDATTQPCGGDSALTPQMCKPVARFETTDTGGLLQLRAAQNTSHATPSTINAGSWLRLTELGRAGGTTTFIKTYAATGSRSYDGSGNPIGGSDGDNNVYQGDGGRAGGNERSMLIFPGSTIRSDLAGATVLSARLFLYCFTAEESLGSLVEPATEPNTSVPATYGGPPASSSTSLHDAWPVPGWQSVECLFAGGATSLLNGILAGDNAVGLPSTTFGLAFTGFRGFGHSVDLRPYFQVTYAL